MQHLITRTLEPDFELVGHPLYWLTLAFLILTVDYITGPLIQFPILYLIPIGLASWYSGRGWGLIFALSMPLIRLYFSTLWDAPWTIFEAAINITLHSEVEFSHRMCPECAKQHYPDYFKE